MGTPEQNLTSCQFDTKEQTTTLGTIWIKCIYFLTRTYMWFFTSGHVCLSSLKGKVSRFERTLWWIYDFKYILAKSNSSLVVVHLCQPRGRSCEIGDFLYYVLFYLTIKKPQISTPAILLLVKYTWITEYLIFQTPSNESLIHTRQYLYKHLVLAWCWHRSGWA